MSEFSRKQNLIRTFLAERDLDALVLQRVGSFAWATCGAASYVNTATTTGEGTLLITPSDLYLFTNNIESTRLEQEEKLAEQGWQFHVGPWYEGAPPLAELTAGLRLGADVAYPGAVDLSAELARVRANLSPEEVARFRILGCLGAEAMDSAIRAIRPGMTEYEIAGILDQESEKRGAQPIVNLIATDERIWAYRHPLPTGKTLENYAMLVLCGRMSGLVCSITRLVHFGPLPDELRHKQVAVAQVDATFVSASRPGRTLGRIFEKAQAAYAAAGFADEWQYHHQGGPAGYEAREYIAVPGSTDTVATGQTYAWNPSVAGCKSEDTILVGEAENEVLSAIEGWPELAVEVEGRQVVRPAILEVT
jgi:Xaa-Pro aminopeptidase